MKKNRPTFKFIRILKNHRMYHIKYILPIYLVKYSMRLIPDVVNVVRPLITFNSKSYTRGTNMTKKRLGLIYHYQASLPHLL